eukprot:4779496-Prymnesium_polylepis.1
MMSFVRSHMRRRSLTSKINPWLWPCSHTTDELSQVAALVGEAPVLLRGSCLVAVPSCVARLLS